MSLLPKPPSRFVLKNSQCSSRDRAGTFSSEALLTFAPRLTGAPHGASRLARSVTQRSRPPNPPGRSEPKYSVRPSLEIAGPASMNAEFTIGPRFTGAAQSEYAGPALG